MEAKMLSARMDLVKNINRDEWIKIIVSLDENEAK
jgi:hypothetical protein